VLRGEVAGWLLLDAGTHTLEGPPVLEAKVHLFLLLPVDLREPPQALRLLVRETPERPPSNLSPEPNDPQVSSLLRQLYPPDFPVCYGDPSSTPR
jgi:hypothetical protein